MMDAQALFNAVITLLGIFAGFLLKSTYDAIRELRQSDGHLHERINAIPSTYARRDDVMHIVGDIKSILVRIEDKLDNKADK